MCLGEVNEGKKFAVIKVEEIEDRVVEADARDDPAITGRYTGENKSGKAKGSQENFWPWAYSRKYLYFSTP